MRNVILTLAVTIATSGFVALLIAGPGHVRAAQTEIEADNFYFCDQSFQGSVCEKTITAGDTVVWSVEGGSHTVTECDATFTTCPPAGGFNSGPLGQGQQFQHNFASAGTVFYRCNFHPEQMRGKLVVQAQTTATPTPAPSATPAPTATPAASPTPAAVPKTGGGPSDGSGATPEVLIFAGAIAAIAGAALAFRSKRTPSA